MTRRELLWTAAIAAALVAVVLVLTFAIPSGSRTPAPPAASSTAAPATVGSPTTPAPPMDSDPPAPLTPARWEDKDAQQAAYAAGWAISAYTAKGRSPADWWNALAPVLSPTAQVAYARTDPAQVPGTKVTGDPAATPGGSFYVATAVVPTDAGQWLVLLSRADTPHGADNPWRVEQMTPPAGTH